MRSLSFPGEGLADCSEVNLVVENREKLTARV